MTWLQSQKKCCYADFLKVPLTKISGENTHTLPNFAFNRNIFSGITRDVEGNRKLKTIVLITDY